jgi:hypothetical protein
MNSPDKRQITMVIVSAVIEADLTRKGSLGPKPSHLRRIGAAVPVGHLHPQDKGRTKPAKAEK